VILAAKIGKTEKIRTKIGKKYEEKNCQKFLFLHQFIFPAAFPAF